MRITTFIALLGGACVSTGCILFPEDEDVPSGGCPEGKICDSSLAAGPIHDVRADGTVDIEVDDVWPNRGAEPDPLTAEELAQACALMDACIPAEPPGDINNRRLLYSLCVDAKSSYFWEERAVPTSKKIERWTFEARAIIATKGDCTAVNAVATPRPAEIVCEEAGCWWASLDKPIPSVTCNGDVATLTTDGLTFVRDCSRSLARCDTSSATGCSDRMPTACKSPAKDRCDGAVRIGCDGTGKVSFHDCARVPGGTCGKVDEGLGCVYPSECPVGPATCMGDSLSTCVFGKPTVVDCAALGLSACSEGLCWAK